MIYTVTFNPCLDYFIQVDSFLPGRVNRTVSEEIYPGGKGINVSLVLKSLGIESRILGFEAGFTGDALESSLVSMGCSCDFVSAKGLSRINVKIKSGGDTEINARGPEITEEAVTQLINKLDGLQDGDVLVLAGSIPQSLPSNIYQSLLETQKEKHLDIVVDTEKSALLDVLSYHPFLIKPNHHELGALFDRTLDTEEEICIYAKRLQEMGARNVLVSRAEQGAFLLTEEGKTLSLPAPAGTVISAVGAGDSMVAGFLAGWLDRRDYAQALKLGLAAGSATAFSEGLADGPCIWELYRTL